MELPKALLGAILLGITIEASSCKKSNDDMPKPGDTTNVVETSQPQQPVEPCEACGMG